MTQPKGIHSFTLKAIDGRERSLAQYAGKALLLVNVASECGFTPQYKDLEALHRRYQDRGFMVLGFPCDDFGHQEPGADAEVKSFCERNYGVSFDLFSKIRIKDEPRAPLYQYLTAEAGFDGPVAWNFAKFLAGRDGAVLARWDPKVKPLAPEIVSAVEKALQ
ncbi:MAG TPA: glutathione peroxidase [bacterium]|jgi:glutathione peroxidase|nr:glutathione peroxidase [bacterium]